MESGAESLKFVEALWRISTPNDTPILMKLANAYEDGDDESRAILLIEEFLSRSAPFLDLAVIYIRCLTTVDRAADALEFINRFKPEFSKEVDFVSAWADVLLHTNDLVGIDVILSQDTPGLQALRTSSPVTYANLLRLGRRGTELDSFLTQSLQSAIRGGPSAELQRVGELFERFGRWEEFERHVRSVMTERTAIDFLNDVRRRRGMTVRRPVSVRYQRD